jgi:hypothetical protein
MKLVQCGSRMKQSKFNEQYFLMSFISQSLGSAMMFFTDKVCLSGATCLPTNFCFSELAL